MEDEEFKYRYSKPIEPVKILKGAEKIKERLLVAKGNVSEFKDKIKEKMDQKKARNEELNKIRSEAYEDERENKAMQEGRLRATRGRFYGFQNSMRKVSKSISKIPIASGKINVPDINLGQQSFSQSSRQIQSGKKKKKMQNEFDFGSVL